MALLLALVLCQDPAADIDRLVRDLGDELIEVRDRAQQQLIRLGPATIPALRRALGSPDAERRARVWATLLKVDRTERERDHDAGQMRQLFSKLHPDFLNEWKDKPLKFEGSNFSISAVSTKRGVFICTQAHNLLMRHEAGILGGVTFDVESLQDASGAGVEMERCANCSPGLILAKRQDAGPLKARVAGVQTWFSRYPLEFPEPRNGQVREVGDMTVEIAWPVIKVTSKNGWQAAAVRQGRFSFEFDLKPGSTRVKPRILIGGMGLTCGAGPERPRPGWCSCEAGPVDPGPRRELPRTYVLEVKAQTGDIPLEDVSSIRCTVWKPLEIPIDFTVELKPLKREE